MSAGTSVSVAVRCVVAQQLGLQIDQIAPDATLASLRFDSIDRIELAMGLEDFFRIEIGDEEGDAIAGIADAVALVERKQAEARDA